MMSDINGLFQESAPMDEVEVIPRVYIEPHHRGTHLVQTQSADIPRVLEELRSRGVEYNEHVMTSVLQGCNAINAELNTVKSSHEVVLRRMAQLELSQNLTQVNQLDLAQAARKREREKRLEAFKGPDNKREMGTLIDLEHLVEDQDKLLESLHPTNLDSLLKGQEIVPKTGYVAKCGTELTEQALSGLIAGHIRHRSRLYDQIRVLEAAAKSGLGKQVIPHLQPNWDHYHAGSLEEKEAFDERVKLAEKAVRAENAAQKAQRQQSQKGQGPRGAASLAANLSQPLKAGTQQRGGGGGKPAAKAGRKRKRVPRCHKCKVRGHIAPACPGAQGSKPSGTG